MQARSYRLLVAIRRFVMDREDSHGGCRDPELLGHTVNSRAREIRTDSIRFVASRKLQSSIFGAVSTPHQAGTSRSPPVLSTDNEHVLSPLGRCGLFVFNSSFAGMNQDHRSAEIAPQRFDHPHPGLERTPSLMVIGASGKNQISMLATQCLL